MRIISRFRDYYDGLMDHEERDLIYVRETKNLPWDDEVSATLTSKHMSAPTSFRWSAERLLGQDAADQVAREWSGQIVPTYEPPDGRYSPNYHAFESETILFCGRLYRGVVYREQWKNMRENVSGVWGKDGKTISKVYWDKASFLKDFVYEPKKRWRSQNEMELQKDERQVFHFLDTFFAGSNDPALMDVHFKTGCPVLGVVFDPEQTRMKDYKTGALTAALNPCLKDAQFIRKMNPHTCFQELSMFIGGVMAHNDTPEPVDNKYKIIAHGFDLKDSFRKGPTKEHR